MGVQLRDIRQLLIHLTVQSLDQNKRLRASHLRMARDYRKMQKQVMKGQALEQLASHVAAELGIVNTERHDIAVRKDTKLQSIKLPKR